MNYSKVKDPIVEALQGFTSCDVSDGLCALGQADGGFLSGLSMWSPKRQEGDTKIIGPAYTVKSVLADDPAPKHPSHYIDSIPEGAVVFVSSPCVPNAVFGGLMAMRSKASGAVGAVIDGRFRDLEEQRGQGFPIFARNVGTAPPKGVKVVAVNVPVKLQSPDQDVTVHPGDYIVADLNGVVALPRDKSEAAITAMTKKVDGDSKMAVEIQKGVSFTEASKMFR